jgi:hypothetical protein
MATARRRRRCHDLGVTFVLAWRFSSVLDDGRLPRSQMGAGRPVPIGFWSGNRPTAVMAIEDCDHDQDCRDDQYLSP